MDTVTDRYVRLALHRIRTETAVEAFVHGFSLEMAHTIAEAIQGNPLLRTLCLNDSSIGPFRQGGLPQMEALVAGFRGSSVRALRLQSTGLGKEEARALGNVLKETSLESLDLSFNSLGVEGVRALVEGLKSSSVTALDLTANEIQDDGARALAAGLADTSLLSLTIGRNGIGVGVVQALTQSLKSSRVATLGLNSNVHIGEQGAQVLLAALRDSPVTELDLEYCFLERQETFNAIQAVLAANKARTFVIQMQVQRFGDELLLKFRTMAGSEAAVLTWSVDRPVQELPLEVLTAMRSAGFPPAFNGLSTIHLRLVRPDGAILDVAPTAASLALQLGIE